MNKVLIVPEINQPTRLDKFLHASLPNHSRASLQRAIREGGVTVNGKNVTTVHHWLRMGDKIELQHVPEPAQAVMRPNARVIYKLVAETPDFIVVDKPAGLVVHPAPGIDEPTLVDGLAVKYPEILKVGEGHNRPGLVHRLDREVSGLLVIARNQPTYEHLKKQFMNHSVNKEYIGLVIGCLTQPSGTIDFPLARSKRNHGKIAARAKPGEDTRQAITHYTVITQYQQVTLLRINLETGRTHQIRAHLAALGYPLVGDALYRPAKIDFKKNPGRIFLHAISLAFSDLNNEKRAYTSPLPPDLQEFLHNLK